LKLDVAANEEVLPVDDALICGEFDAIIEFGLGGQGSPGCLRAEAKRERRMFDFANRAGPHGSVVWLTYRVQLRAPEGVKRPTSPSAAAPCWAASATGWEQLTLDASATERGTSAPAWSETDRRRRSLAQGERFSPTALSNRRHRSSEKPSRQSRTRAEGAGFG
jgi:hypothetical protein